MKKTFNPWQRAFSGMAKPVGSGCNLTCEYCYYLDKEHYLYSEPSARYVMDEALLERYVEQTLSCSSEPVVPFIWHGGEPTLRGLDFFKKAVRWQQYYGRGRQVENSVQTNGTTLTEDWCKFFADHQFLVGLSIDGPAHCHDRYRVAGNGQGSFTRCMKGLELLIRYNVEFNTLSAVNDYTSKYPVEIYRFLKSIGSRVMQFLPVVEWVDPSPGPGEPGILPADTVKSGVITDWTVDPLDYGEFLIRIFDEWVRKDVGDYYVVTFDSVLANWIRESPALCVFSITCDNAGVVEHNGDVFACDHYVFPEYKLGNIRESSLLSLLTSRFQDRFGKNKRALLPAYCLKCEFLDLCNGECPKNRIVSTPDGDPGLNYLCPGLRLFYRHTEPFFQFMANELTNRRPPSNVQKWARERDGTP